MGPRDVDKFLNGFDDDGDNEEFETLGSDVGGFDGLPKFGCNQKQWHAAQLMIFTDLIDKEIAAKVGVNRTSITRWKKKPEFNKALSYFGTLRTNMFIKEAQDKMVSLMNAEKETVQFNAAKYILDKADVGKQAVEIDIKKDAVDDLLEALTNDVDEEDS